MDTITEIYYADRGIVFKKFIENLLIKGKIAPKYMEKLLTEENMIEYSNAFTSSSVDQINNYENYEQIGDLSANAFIVNYMYSRFPKLKSTEGLKVVARLRINYGAKQSFSKIADDLGFFPFISATVQERSTEKKSLLEDALEAFLGCTQYLLDYKLYRPGVGYGIVYDILTNIFDKIDISFKYVDLYDAKTRLKELFDHVKTIGILNYNTIKNDKIFESTVYRSKDGRKFILGTGTAFMKQDAEQNAAKIGIITLEKEGITREELPIYNELVRLYNK